MKTRILQQICLYYSLQHKIGVTRILTRPNQRTTFGHLIYKKRWRLWSLRRFLSFSMLIIHKRRKIRKNKKQKAKDNSRHHLFCTKTQGEEVEKANKNHWWCCILKHSLMFDAKVHPLQISINIFQVADSVLFGHSKPLAEILLHEGEAIPQLHFWLPSQQFCSLCDVRFPLSWIVRGIVHLLYLHLRINKLQNHTQSALMINYIF